MIKASNKRNTIHKERAWEINYKELQFEKEIGEGAYGKVYKYDFYFFERVSHNSSNRGYWRQQRVAIKELKAETLKGALLTEFASGMTFLLIEFIKEETHNLTSIQRWI